MRQMERADPFAFLSMSELLLSASPRLEFLELQSLGAVRQQKQAVVLLAA